MLRGLQRTRIGTAGWCALLSAVCPVFAAAAETGAPAAVLSFDELRPTLSTPDGRFSLSLRARLQIDAGGFDQAGDVADVTPERDVEFKDLNSGALVRRAYLGIEGRAFRDLRYEFRLDFGGDAFRIADPYVHLARISYHLGNYDAGPLLRLNAGLIKPIFTYNDPTSSASLPFIPSARPWRTLRPRRSAAARRGSAPSSPSSRATS
jgi:phosphate-selective porin OprO/OprP